MLHMVDQVSSYKFKEGDVVVDNDAIYDEVRGVTAAPLRKTAEEDSMQQADQEQAEMVWKNLLQSKTTRKGGGHEYFAIQTKQG